MAIPYTIIKQSHPRNPEETIYYPRAVANGVVEIEDLIDELEMSSTLSGADIQAVVHGLTDLVARKLSKGKIVRFGQMGSFRVTFQAEACDSEESVSQAAIKKAKLSFLPESRFKRMLNTLSFTKK